MTSCSEQVLVDSEKSAFRIYGDAQLLGITNIEPTSDGGFVIGATQYKLQDSEYRLLRFDGNGDVVWDKTYEIKGGQSLDRIHVNREGQVLMSGIVRGYNYYGTNVDTARTYVILNVLVDSEGEIIWQKKASIGTRRFEGDRITDVIQDGNGDYILSGHLYWFEKIAQPNVYGSGSNGVLVRIRKDGNLMRYAVARNDPGIPYVYDYADEYGCFQVYPNSGWVSYARLKKNFVLRVDPYHEVVNKLGPIESNEKGEYQNALCTLKRPLQDNKVAFVVFTGNGGFRATYDYGLNEVEVNELPRDLPITTSACNAEGGNMILKTREGEIVIVNNEFEVLQRFEVGFASDENIQLNNGNHVVALFKNRNLNISMFNQNGEPIGE